MPGSNLHQSLMTQPTGIPPYGAIPTLASWKGDIVRAMNRLQQFRREAGDRQRQAFWRSVQQAQHMQQSGRLAGDLTNPTVVDAALQRYHAGVLNAGPPDNQLSKSIHGSLLVDIYTVTGQFMRSISRNAQLRTDRDCALFPLYRELHYAAADEFGRVFGINGDEIDVYLRQQLIFMSTHGAGVDTNVGGMKRLDANGEMTSRLAYLSDQEALAFRLHIEGGRFMITNGRGVLEPFDCSGPEYQDVSREMVFGTNPATGFPGWVPGGFTETANPARRGNEQNSGRGVAGFAMGLNRNIYARKHSNYDAAKGSFYHSCYLEGRELLCTGCITVVKGELKYINNWSGHYQPSRQQLSLAVQALRAQGVDITNVIVEYQQTNGTYETKKGPAFLESDGVKGADFDGFSKGRFVATARKVREALVAYEKLPSKTKTVYRWFGQSTASKDALASLKKIRDDETLVREVRFLLGEKMKKGKGYQPTSPLQTPESGRLNKTGDLAQLLATAMEGFERY